MKSDDEGGEVMVAALTIATSLFSPFYRDSDSAGVCTICGRYVAHLMGVLAPDVHAVDCRARKLLEVANG